MRDPGSVGDQDGEHRQTARVPVEHDLVFIDEVDVTSRLAEEGAALLAQLHECLCELSRFTRQGRSKLLPGSESVATTLLKKRRLSSLHDGVPASGFSHHSPLDGLSNLPHIV